MVAEGRSSLWRLPGLSGGLWLVCLPLASEAGFRIVCFFGLHSSSTAHYQALPFGSHILV